MNDISISGWVNPRYLDEKWCTTFSVQRDRKKSVDIPVVVSFQEKAYVAAFANNDHPTYGELLEANKKSKTDFYENKIKNLEADVAKLAKILDTTVQRQNWVVASGWRSAIGKHQTWQPKGEEDVRDNQKTARSLCDNNENDLKGSR